MIYTFYSYKGGVGRSMALANVAQWLYLQGLHVLMVDWDLEAPGLEEFFFDQVEDLEHVRAHPGLIDLLLAYRRTYPSLKPRLPSAVADGDAPAPSAAAKSVEPTADNSPAVRQDKAAVLRRLLPPVADAIVSLKAPSDPTTQSGSLKLMTAGWRAGEHFHDYALAVQSFDWAEFYDAFDGEAYFDCLRELLQAEADIVLVDSRTGVSEMGGVCTRQLADVVVCLCAPNRQNVQGLVGMIRSFKRSTLIEARGRLLEVVAVPTRIENSEITLLNQFSREFTSYLEPFAPDAFKRAQRTFWNLRIPYVPRYAYAETLAVGVSDTSSDLEGAYRALAAHLLLLAPRDILDDVGPALAAEVRSLLPPEQHRVPRRILISARSDGRALASAVFNRLAYEGSASATLLDMSEVASGSGDQTELETALSQSHALLAIITPGALTSPWDLHELRVARSKGLPIVPVRGHATIEPSSLPPWLRTYRLFDPEREWAAMVGALRSDERPPKVPFMAPPLPEQLVKQSRQLEQLVGILTPEPSRRTQAPSISLVGLGGSGKSVLAAAVCHDPRIIEEFYDGILWTTLGLTPDLVRALTELYAGLTGERPAFLGVDDASAALQEKLGARRCLIVLDDVWNEAHLSPFLRGGPRCDRLLTTRNYAVARAAEHVMTLGALSQREAVTMLASYFDERAVHNASLAHLANRLGYLPLLLALTGSALRDRIRGGDSSEGALDYAHSALDRRGVTAFDRQDAVERSQALARTLELTLGQLTTDERSQYALLAAFPENAAIRLSAAQHLWELDDFDAEELARKLDSLSLVRLDFHTRTLSLHPVIREFLREALKDPKAVEARAAALMAPAEIKREPKETARRAPKRRRRR